MSTRARRDICVGVRPPSVIPLREVFDADVNTLLLQDRDLIITAVHKFFVKDKTELLEFRIVPDRPVPGLTSIQQTGFLRENRGSPMFYRLQDLYLTAQRFRLEGERWRLAMLDLE